MSLSTSACFQLFPTFGKKIMRKIIVTQFITLDGVTEAPGGNETNHPHAGWQSHFRSPEGGKYKLDELSNAGALLLGRKTYDQFAPFWPTQAGTEFGDRMNKLPKYIVSGSLQKADWSNSQILRNVATDVAAVKNTAGGDILIYGSATLTKSLLHHNLVDEIRLMLFPVVVGGGLKLFDDNLELKKFTLKSSRALENGTLILEYNTVA
jgi:dihydrofolate reductase